MANKYIEMLDAKRTKEFTTVTVAIKNNKTASMLKALASGKYSELTASTTYIYQHIVSENSYPEIAAALEEIGINEMTHLDALMAATLAFGGNPTYTNGQGSFWNARLVNYNNNVQKYLNENIKAEEVAIADYEKAKTKTDNQSLITLFDEIINDEKIHIEIFKEMLKDIQ